jgi:imidazole glycerol-phosphate synthase subunit HisH
VITIIDYNTGNPGSVLNMLTYLGIKAEITSDLSRINDAEKIILSGVGSFDTGMMNLAGSGLQELLNRKIITEKTPVLGICLGMQLMGKKSEEGSNQGLGWIDGNSVKFDSSKVRTPHMMWNTINIRGTTKLLEGFDETTRFYFAHSFYLLSGENKLIAATSEYGIEFVSVIEQGNIAGVQFHPEKSHKFGMKLLRNFDNNF